MSFQFRFALVLAFALCGLATHAQSARLCLSGSNTVGQKLAPALVKAWARQQGWTALPASTPAPDEARLSFETDRGLLVVDVLAHGTGTGFEALRDGRCDLWMASRAVKPEEVQAARSIGDLYERGQEHVIALDGLAVIVHPSNPLRQLTLAQVRDVFAGRIRDWSRVGGAPGAIALHARDDRSGTYDTFRSLVMGETALSPASLRYESTEQLSAAVAADPRAIGFVGLAGVGAARALALSDTGTAPLAPAALAVASEDYVLSRRLVLYSGATPRAEAQAFLDFAVGPSGQGVVRDVGFVPLDVAAFPQVVTTPDAYRELVAGSRRIGLNFRFGEGNAVLDNRALEDVERLARFMAAPAMAGHELVLVGFADRSEITPYMALSLSNDRVDLVAEALRAKGLRVARQRGLGQVAPVASNDNPQGRLRNRRVEVWVRPAPAGVAGRAAASTASTGLR